MLQDIRGNLKKFFTVGPKSTFMVMLIIMILSITIYNMRRELIINIDGNEIEIVSYKKDLKSALLRNNIEVGPKDKINPGIDSIVKNRDKIYIKRAVAIDVAVDGKELKINTAENNVEEMLLAEGIQLSEVDKILPLKTEPIKSGMKIEITRVESQVITETQPIEFSTVIKRDDNLEKTVNKVVQEGETGEREIRTKVVLENGKEVLREVISDIIKKEPVQKVLLQGTLGALNLSRGGEKLLYTNSIRCKATAYHAGFSSTGKTPDMPGYEITASGTRAKRNPSGYSTIAVDPKVIPLGTRVYVEGYGLAIAEDTGGAIKGNTVDVFFNSYNETINWGIKYVNVYILK